MNNNGNIVINGDEVNSSVSYLSSSVINLEGKVLAMLPGKFSVLSDLGLYSNGLSSLLNQVNSLIDSHKVLINLLEQHVEDYAIKEDELTYKLDSGIGNYQASVNRNVTTGAGSSNITVDNVDKGKKIDVNYLLENIPKFTEEKNRQMLELINTKKSKDTSLASLLLDNTLSSQLYVLLKNIMGDDFSSLDNLTTDEYENIQKVFLDTICSGEIEIEELNTKSILSAREYLEKISKENNINISELLFEENNRKMLQESLFNLYDGNEIGKYDISSTTIDNFRAFIDELALENNLTYEELLSNKLDLVINGREYGFQG